MVSIPWRRDHMNILAVYAPNPPQENTIFWTALWCKLLEIQHNRIDIMLGDFNMVEEAIDRLPAHQDPVAPRTELRELCSSLSLLNSWHTSHPTSLQYTFLQTSTNSHSRIDRIYMNESIQRQCTEWHTHPVIGSDHDLVTVRVADTETPYVGPGRWCDVTRSSSYQRQICGIRFMISYLV